MMEIR